MIRQVRNRWTFWATVIVSLALCAVPSAVLWESLRQYYRFLTGYEPGVLKPSRGGRWTHPGTSLSDPETLEFVEFTLQAASARKVVLRGDINRWAATGIDMTRQSNGIWEVLIPLPPGRYRYHFAADGVEKLDPGAPSEVDPLRGRVSIKIVR